MTSTRRCPSTVSFEVMPPRRPELAPKFWATVDQLLASRPDFISVTYGAAGTDAKSAAQVVTRLVKDTPVQPIAHLTCVGTARSQVRATVEGYLDIGVRTFLALRGDPPADHPDWRPAPGDPAHATDLVALMRQIETERVAAHPGAALRSAFKPLTIAVAAFPAGNPAAKTTVEQEAERLLMKQIAGASFAITQLFWDPECYLSFVQLARGIGVSIPIVAGILPPTDPRRVRRLEELTGVQAPRWLLDPLERAETAQEAHDIGVGFGSRIARTVLEDGSPGIHIYTFNQAGPALSLVEGVEKASGFCPAKRSVPKENSETQPATV